MAGEGVRPTRTFFIDLRVSLMMHILGSRGFFEWAIIAQDESVEDLAIQAGNISHVPTSEEWTRMASDFDVCIVHFLSAGGRQKSSRYSKVVPIVI